MNFLESLKNNHGVMRVIILVVILAVLGSAVGMWMNHREGFSPMDNWPYLPPRYWKQREDVQWDPWYFEKENDLYPSVPEISNYSVQDYQFPARTLDMVRHQSEEIHSDHIPQGLPTTGLSEVMAEETHPEAQGLAATPIAQEHVQQHAQEHKEVIKNEGYNNMPRYEGYNSLSQYEEMGNSYINRRVVLISILVVLIAYLIYRNSTNDYLESFL
jgi:hypothetical protein